MFKPVDADIRSILIHNYDKMLAEYEFLSYFCPANKRIDGNKSLS